MYNDIIFHRPILLSLFYPASTILLIFDFLSLSYYLSDMRLSSQRPASIFLATPIDQLGSRRFACNSVLLCIDSQVDLVTHVYSGSPSIISAPLYRHLRGLTKQAGRERRECQHSNVKAGRDGERKISQSSRLIKGALM